MLNLKLLYFMILQFIFIRPHFEITNMRLSLHWPDFALLFLSIYTLYKHKKFSMKEVFTPSQNKYLLLFLCFSFLKTVYYKFSSDHLLVILKFIHYFIINFTLIFLFSTIENSDKFVKKHLKGIYIYIYIVAIIQLLQVPVLFDIVTKIYGQSKLRPIWTKKPRVYSTYFNANWFGVYIIFIFSIINGKYLTGKISLKKFSTYFFFNFLLLIISGSRTALIGLFVLIIVQFLLSSSYKKKLFFITFFILISVVLIIVMTKNDWLFGMISRYFYFYLDIFTEKISVSLLAGSRLPHWQESISFIMKYPIFGSPVNIGNSHNSYLSLLINFGIIGTILILAFLFESKKKVSMRLNAVFIERFDDLYISYFGFLFSFLIMSLAANYFYSTQIMLTFFVLHSIFMSEIQRND